MTRLGRFVETVFGWLLIAILVVGGGLGTYRIGSFLARVIEVGDWATTTCRVDDLWLEDVRFGSYVVRGEFIYRWDGRVYTSRDISLLDVAYNDAYTDSPNVDGWNAGSEVECLVNPEAPEEALLRKPYWLAVAFAWPGFFLVVACFGAGLVFAKRMVAPPPETDAA